MRPCGGWRNRGGMAKPKKSTGAGKLFAVKYFDQFQHFKKTCPPWVKLYYSLLDNGEFIALPVEARHHYLMLLLIASRCENRIKNDRLYLKKVMRLDAEPDLTPLFASGFLIAIGTRPNRLRIVNHTSNVVSESEAYLEREREEHI